MENLRLLFCATGHNRLRIIDIVTGLPKPKNNSNLDFEIKDLSGTFMKQLKVSFRILQSRRLQVLI